MSKAPHPIAVHIDAAAKHVGGYSALAKGLGVAPSSPHMWKARGAVPAEHVAVISQMAPEVARWDLRPDDWHRIWPELVGTEGAPAIPTTAAPAAQQLEARDAA